MIKISTEKTKVSVFVLTPVSFQITQRHKKTVSNFAIHFVLLHDQGINGITTNQLLPITRFADKIWRKIMMTTTHRLNSFQTVHNLNPQFGGGGRGGGQISIQTYTDT